MKLTFIGATHEVTGSCFLIETDGCRFLIDCGMKQGPNIYENVEIPVNLGDIDFVLLTHAHIDHSGDLPAIYAKGFRGNVYATEATCDLCDIMLRDSAHIQMFEAEWRNRKGKRAGKDEFVPAYTMDDALGVLKNFVGCAYDEIIHLDEDVQVRFVDAGHLLGSSSIEVWVTERREGVRQTEKIVFSGDIGNLRQPLIKDPTYVEEADYVVMESTYGERSHGERIDYVRALAEVIQTTFDRGGNVVIPSFAVGRTQEMLYFIRQIKEDGLIRGHEDFSVYVDSPLAVEATSIFGEHRLDCYDEDARALIDRGVNPISFNGLKISVTAEDSRGINFVEEPKVIISASGMCDAGRIKHHLKHNLWRKECTVCFVGYQAVGTLGRKLIEGAECVRLFGETVEVNAKIETLKGISGHADMNGLLGWLGGFKTAPQHVFVVHGEDTVTDEFAKTVTDTYGWPAMAPYSGGCVDLATGEIISVGIREPKKAAEKPSQVRKQNAFYRVVAAAKKLLEVVYKNEGLANKELAKFEGQIQNLADKWDR